jgi:hypothetical protein
MKTEINYTLDKELITVTHTTIDIILKKSKYPSDCLSLYMFYAYTAKWQSTNRVFAVSDYAKNGLGIGKDRFSHAKSELKRLNLIEDYADRDKTTGKINKWYVKVNYVLNPHPTENRPSGETTPKCLVLVPEMLETGKGEAVQATANAVTEKKNLAVEQKVSPQPTHEVDVTLPAAECSVSRQNDYDEFDELLTDEQTKLDKAKLFFNLPSSEEIEKNLDKSAQKEKQRSEWLELKLDTELGKLQSEFDVQYHEFYLKNTKHIFRPDNYGKYVKMIKPVIVKLQKMTELVCVNYYDSEPTNQMYSNFLSDIFKRAGKDKFLAEKEFEYYYLPSSLPFIMDNLISDCNKVLCNTNKPEILIKFGKEKNNE